MTGQLFESFPAETWRKRKTQESMLFGAADRVLRNPQGIIAVGGLALL